MSKFRSSTIKITKDNNDNQKDDNEPSRRENDNQDGNNKKNVMAKSASIAQQCFFFKVKPAPKPSKNFNQGS